jgi:hypothetical protein
MPKPKSNSLDTVNSGHPWKKLKIPNHYYDWGFAYKKF